MELSGPRTERSRARRLSELLSGQRQDSFVAKKLSPIRRWLTARRQTGHAFALVLDEIKGSQVGTASAWFAEALGRCACFFKRSLSMG
jgi:hypothetical protein